MRQFPFHPHVIGTVLIFGAAFALVSCGGKTDEPLRPTDAGTQPDVVTGRDADSHGDAGVDVETPRTLSLGASQSCMGLASGAIACWGGNESGQLGRECADPLLRIGAQFSQLGC